jgi:sugar O-acyltransferase (sialic acid O-acetyltransferase NeuD family)
MSEKFGILGNGGQADEVESFAERNSVEFRAVDRQYVDPENAHIIDILSPEAYQKKLAVIAAIGAPAVRKQLIEKWSGEKFTSIISESAYIDETVKLGEGSIVAPRAVITTNVEIGRHCLINVAATISHDCKLGEYVTVSPGAHIGGKVVVGEGAFIGIGAIIINGIKIANGAVIGAGAVVTKDIDTENSVFAGVPAKFISQNDGWLSEV